MIRYPPIPLDEQTSYKGKISNQMKNKVKTLKNLYKKHLLITKGYKKEKNVQIIEKRTVKSLILIHQDIYNRHFQHQKIMPCKEEFENELKKCKKIQNLIIDHSIRKYNFKDRVCNHVRLKCHYMNFNQLIEDWDNYSIQEILESYLM